MDTHITKGLVFLTDLTGFGRLIKGMDLARLVDTLGRFAVLTQRHVEGAGGTVVKYLGDSALGYFPASLVDAGVAALIALKRETEATLEVAGSYPHLRVGAHYGEFAVAALPPVAIEDIHGDTVNIAASLGSGGQNSHRGRMVISPAAFRALSPESRKSFHKFTEPIVYLADV